MPLLPPGSHTIVAFGDSTTAPRTVEGRPLVVYADLLRAELPPRGITGEVINSGVPGQNTRDGLARFERDVLVCRPGLVIIQFGINDSTLDLWQDPPVTEPRVPLADFIANLTTMIRRLRAVGAQAVLLTPNPMRWTEVTCGYYAKAPYQPDDPLGMNVTLTPYVAAVRALAGRENASLVDVYELFTAQGDGMDVLLLDGMHPNAIGHRLVADALLQTIAPRREAR
jgi:lysophospholipase L1-like esterase